MDATKPYGFILVVTKPCIRNPRVYGFLLGGVILVGTGFAGSPASNSGAGCPVWVLRGPLPLPAATYTLTDATGPPLRRTPFAAAQRPQRGSGSICQRVGCNW